MAYITPVLKKQGLNPADASSYRPISNLSVLSKLLERLVAQQLQHCLCTAGLLPTLPSGFWPRHSTKTAILRVLTDILSAVDRGDFAALVLADRPICCVRHGQPRHSAAEVTDKHRHFQCYPQVVPVVPDQQYPVRSSWQGLVDYSSADMWCSTWLSAWADHVHHVYTADLVSLIQQHCLSPQPLRRRLC